MPEASQKAAGLLYRGMRMVFSGLIFLYFFLPVSLALGLLLPKKARNAALLCLSLFFYFFGEPKYIVLMAATIFIAWGFGLLAARAKRYKRLPLVLSSALSLSLLLYFKYADFFISNLNGIFGTAMPLLRVVLPIGISFYTFQSISYVADVTVGRVKAERSLIDFAAYITFFPQLIAGPIVRYDDVAEALKNPTRSLAGFSAGVLRFCVGLGKKVLIANVLSELVTDFSNANEKTVLFYWLYAVGNALSIYFDFSGYSDMAIGLGRMFGFEFPENFRHPFASRSVGEFWRRWHITLGAWFRDYVYIPLGGSRVKLPRQLLNLLVVWALTGLWHGASWVFVAWGLYFAVFLMLERLFLAKWLLRAPRAVSHVYVVLVTLVSFVLFSAPSVSDAVQTVSAMFGGACVPILNGEALYALQSYGVVLAAALIGAVPTVPFVLQRLRAKSRGAAVCTVLQPVLTAALLVASTAYLVAGSFNPFLYFRF